MGALKTEPPLAQQKRQHHWLVAERAWHPSLAEWIRGQWFCVNETGPVSPEEMWRRGWRWGAVAKPPKRIRPAL